jgi:hypothetical protein
VMILGTSGQTVSEQVVSERHRERWSLQGHGTNDERSDAQGREEWVSSARGTQVHGCRCFNGDVIKRVSEGE